MAQALKPAEAPARNRASLAHRRFVGGVQVVQECGPALVRAKRLALFGHELFELVDADLLHEELDAGAGAALLFTEAREHTRHSLRKGKELFLRAELGEHLGLHRHRAEPSADHDAESALAVSELRYRPEVVEGDETTRIVFAARESDLELTAEILNVGVTQQVLRDRVGVRSDVERLRGADPGVLAGGHVADAVATGFARGDPDRREPAHHVGSLFDVNEVKLNVLACRDVKDRIGVLFGELAQHLELLDGELPERNLDAHHARRVPHRVRPLGQVATGEGQRLLTGAVVTKAVVVALPVHTSAKPGLGEDLVVDLALLFELDLTLEEINLATEWVRDPITKLLFPRSHDAPLPRPSKMRPQGEL